MNKNNPAAATTTPMTRKMPEKWLKSPAGGSIELNAVIAPKIMSANAIIFSAKVMLSGMSGLMLVSSRVNVTVSGLILIWWLFNYEQTILPVVDVT